MLSIMNEINLYLLLPLYVLYDIQNQIFRQFFGLKCAKLSTFCILQIFATTNMVDLRAENLTLAPGLFLVFYSAILVFEAVK